MKKFAIALPLVLALVSVGCNGQVPKPTTPIVALTCTAPIGFVAGAGNGFVFARAVCTSATNCPSNIAGNTAFSALNATPVAACSYTDATPPTGTLVIYTVSTVQAGQTSQPSAPSNSGVPSSIPTVPGAPGGLSGTPTSAMLAPPIGTHGPVVATSNMPSGTELGAKVIFPGR